MLWLWGWVQPKPDRGRSRATELSAPSVSIEIFGETTQIASAKIERVVPFKVELECKKNQNKWDLIIQRGAALISRTNRREIAFITDQKARSEACLTNGRSQLGKASLRLLFLLDDSTRVKRTLVTRERSSLGEAVIEKIRKEGADPMDEDNDQRKLSAIKLDGIEEGYANMDGLPETSHVCTGFRDYYLVGSISLSNWEESTQNVREARSITFE
ncbi:hypothetical protein Bca52824_087070 [Brassica carinata]|uniref:Uncharacterized protein n=1 Tax=Brassica carinata TaxID=52824 RepID=A0A8X7TML0_BRACI|nr:hypothetical protein Bca52824_087070 [Brassica carinata]